jgi:signal transduction histidine kinase
VVTDDGVGFDPKTVKGGIGIKNLKKRVASLNGTLDITSKPGEGSAIKVVFPL